MLLVVLGGISWHAQPGAGGTDSPARAHAPGPAGGSPAAPGDVPDALPTAAPAPTRAGAPVEITVPSLDVRADVRPVRTVGGLLVPPSNPAVLGWWAAGARPGDPRGTALVAGHTVHAGGGALDHLADLRPGDRLTVTTTRGELRYAVRSVRTFTKGTVAERAETLFGQRGPGQLVLVTCADWDGERYLSNVVVVARPG
ncbi:class F sortase [Nocardioides guangzhouensis]|uniref:Class F sortase n=1 Tax=Nocardioides guangzhouensis TaxID=2497878 RepID=A0A4Q4ZHA7_9ACTN|nr:class F sortase [Nocardioides guangzhouensis]